MTVRRLDLLDFLALAHYRRDMLTFDSARTLTRGVPLGTADLLSSLNSRNRIHTAVASENGKSLMGQVSLADGETSAHLTFLAPAKNANGLTLMLLDRLAVQAGEWGAFHLLAEVEESAAVFRELRQAGFSMYAWQRVWRLLPSSLQAVGVSWRPAESQDWPAVRSLHDQIVPALLHPVEVLSKNAIGLVYCPATSLDSIHGALLAHVTVCSGPSGVWLQPLIHPDSECVPELLAGLLHAVGRRQPVYLCVRSYQAWLESVLEEFGAQACPQQAVMVKRLANLQKVELSVKAMDKVLAKPAAPVARIVDPSSTDLNRNL